MSSQEHYGKDTTEAGIVLKVERVTNYGRGHSSSLCDFRT